MPCTCSCTHAWIVKVQHYVKYLAFFIIDYKTFYFLSLCFKNWLYSSTYCGPHLGYITSSTLGKRDQHVQRLPIFRSSLTSSIGFVCMSLTLMKNPSLTWFLTPLADLVELQYFFSILEGVFEYDDPAIFKNIVLKLASQKPESK